jgi:invasion protein IalB
LETTTGHVIARIRPLKGSQLQGGRKSRTIAREPQGISMNLKSLLAVGMALAMLIAPAAARAQDAAPQEQATEKTVPAPASATPEQNWLKVCDPMTDGKRACLMRQVVLTPNGQFLGALQLRVAEGQESEPVLMAAVPLGVLLPPRLTLQIDGGTAIGVPFAQCNPQSCVATIVVNQAFINSLRKGGKLSMTARNRKNEAIVITINLAGFTAVLDGEAALTTEEFNSSSDQNALQKMLNERAEAARQNLQQGDASSAPETPQTSP